MAIRNYEPVDWLDTLSPSKIALRSASVMGVVTACLTALAEVSLVTAVVRTMVAVVLFTGLGWIAGFIITNIDFNALSQGSTSVEMSLHDNANDLQEAVFDIPSEIDSPENAVIAASVIVPTVEPEAPSLLLDSVDLMQSEPLPVHTATPLPVTVSGPMGAALDAKPTKSRKLVVG